MNSARGDTLSGHIYVTRVRGAQDVCVSCRTPAKYRIGYFDGGGRERSLCQRCIDRDLTPRQFEIARRLDGIAEKLVLLSNTSDQEELARTAEIYANMFAGIHTPQVITDFLERFDPARAWLRKMDLIEHTDLADIGPCPAKTDVEAAAVALLAMRSTSSAHDHAAIDRYLISEADGLLSKRGASWLLARIPKPISCRPFAQGRTLAVFVESWLDSVWRDTIEHKRDYWSEKGGFFRLSLRVDPSRDVLSLPVYCYANGESLVVTVASAERFHTDYHTPSEFKAAPPAAFLAVVPVAAREAEGKGAKIFIYFAPYSDELSRVESGDTIVRPGGRPDRPTVYDLASGPLGTCATCGRCDAAWRETVTRMRPWRDRVLCARCVATELLPSALADASDLEQRFGDLSAAQREELDDDINAEVERVSRSWRRLSMPEPLARAIARLERLDPPRRL